MKNLLHRHRWIYQERGIGAYRKGRQQMEIGTTGHSAVCACGLKMFFPDDPRIRPVAIEDRAA